MFKIKWDAWQEEVLVHQGNVTIRAGRQVGKSEVISEKATRFALEHPGTSTMVIAASQRQSSLLFEKVRAKLDGLGPADEFYLEKPTLTKIFLKNGSKIYCLPTGRTGHFIRGFTIDLLIADEAAYIPEAVWLAVTPMLAVSRSERGFGWMILISTPFGKGGFFYQSFTDADFKSFHVSSEDCKRIPPAFLKKERERMSKAEYAQEYKGEFVDEWNQFFSTELIKRCMSFIDWTIEERNPAATIYLGVDFARYGGDENAFVIVELFKTSLKVVKCLTTDRVNTTDTIGRIKELDRVFKFNRIFVDDGGLGGPILDILQEKMGRKVSGLNNSSRKIEVQGEEKKRGILKEDLYSNTLMLMETGKLQIISDLSLLKSMKSIVFEYGSAESGNSRNIKIYGPYSHLTEALVRACWCIKERGLKLYVY